MAEAHPPTADRRAEPRTHHGDTFVDEYAWLRHKEDPAVRAYLEAENAWTEQTTAHLEPLVEELFTDVKARTQETDLSVPTFHSHTDGSAWWYYTRTTEGLDYPAFHRAPATSRDERPDPEQPIPGEELLLDGNTEAEGQEFFSLGAFAVSPDGRRLAYSVDNAGDERYLLQVRDLGSGEPVGEPIPDVGGGVAWLGDDHLVYTRVDESWRPHQVWRHRVGAPVAGDTLVLEEPDERFWLGADESAERDRVILLLGSKLTTEAWLLDAAAPEADPVLVRERREGVEYSITVAGDELFVLHNENSPDFEVARARVDSPAEWREFLPPSEGVRYTDVEAYARFLAIELRRDGLTGVEVHPRDGGQSYPVRFAENLYTVGTTGAEDYDSDRLRLGYTSLLTPRSVLEVAMDTGEVQTLRTTPVLDHPDHGPYRPENYVQERIWATAEDGTKVPMSAVRRADTPLDGTAPALLYGYGAYEICIDPSFSMFRLSLLDKGFVYAIAHVRGGGELGRSWYDNGKTLSKKNTFTDFVSCARQLVSDGYTSADRLAAQGGSAGGLLIGAIANLAPTDFAAVHAAVPFVDALTTILNPELPLTVTEWEEWGDPLHDPEVYAYMRTYSPYENVRATRYPAILATTGFNDTRVYYTEPAKWIAALRANATNDPAEILMRTEMVAGHGGVTGRYKAWREAAFEYAWIIDRVGTR
ncbi:oligopeptidase B [Propionibacteriaceae bacterium ES.041]|uniref:S9 family peptidase n=1 Tax=Enemella evansiae TaxID=2016499 RepID=UPI000B97B822|nr:S9 family peptidase [Enemella evansiae]OYO02266.1 oligopeptidase B [Enemella evansiae]PFG66972.1 oligopeptidase B [Propionibacteriaceae bacterium ES.041]